MFSCVISGSHVTILYSHLLILKYFSWYFSYVGCNTDKIRNIGKGPKEDILIYRVQAMDEVSLIDSDDDEAECTGNSSVNVTVTNNVDKPVDEVGKSTVSVLNKTVECQILGNNLLSDDGPENVISDESNQSDLLPTPSTSSCENLKPQEISASHEKVILATTDCDTSVVLKKLSPAQVYSYLYKGFQATELKKAERLKGGKAERSEAQHDEPRNMLPSEKRRQAHAKAVNHVLLDRNIVDPETDSDEAQSASEPKEFEKEDVGLKCSQIGQFKIKISRKVPENDLSTANLPKDDIVDSKEEVNSPPASSPLITQGDEKLRESIAIVKKGLTPKLSVPIIDAPAMPKRRQSVYEPKAQKSIPAFSKPKVQIEYIPKEIDMFAMAKKMANESSKDKVRAGPQVSCQQAQQLKIEERNEKLRKVALNQQVAAASRNSEVAAASRNSEALDPGKVELKQPVKIKVTENNRGAFLTEESASAPKKAAPVMPTQRESMLPLFQAFQKSFAPRLVKEAVVDGLVCSHIKFYSGNTA